MLDPRELAELEESLKKELDSRWTEILSLLNRSGQLEHFLDLIGLSDLLYPNTGYKPYPTGKIVVIGGSQAKENVLLAIGQSLGINKGRFEMYLDYDAAKTFNFKKMQYMPIYSLILVGPMPHSGMEKGDFGSIISSIEQQNGYPPVVRLGSAGLKITKSNFRSTLEELLASGKIAVWRLNLRTNTINNVNRL